MKKICLITHHPFWQEPLGCGSLIRSRYSLLKEISDQIFVLFITKTKATCPLPGITINLEQGIDHELIFRIKKLISDNKISICYFSYDQFGVIADQLTCKKFVEIHDVMHLREKQFSNFGFQAPYQVGKDAEINSLNRYDAVFCINIQEAAYLQAAGVKSAVYLPPQHKYQPTQKNIGTSAVGLIASMAKPNLDGLRHMQKLATSIDQFVIAGPICRSQEANSIDKKHRVSLGIVKSPSLFYASIDVSISPIRFGGGLKIKVFESLAHGIPLIATSHSINGFPKGIEDLVVLDDDLNAWCYDQYDAALKISPSDIESYFKQNFSDDIAKRKILEVISA